MPVLPRVTVSDALNLRGRGLRVNARAGRGKRRNGASCSRSAGGAKEKFAAFHVASSETSFQGWYTYYGRMDAGSGYQELERAT